jgi:hypothetical protein
LSASTHISLTKSTTGVTGKVTSEELVSLQTLSMVNMVSSPEEPSTMVSMVMASWPGW